MVRVVTDSTADIPEELAHQLGITVVPSYVVFGTDTYRDGVELTKTAFYEKLSSTRVIPKTAAPAPAVYEDVYRQLAKETDEIVSIHLAANLSSLYSVAAVAARNMPVGRIEVIDSGQITMGFGWMAVAAAQAAQRGETLDRIVALVENMKSRSRVLAVLDTLDFLHRGGRVGWAQALIGTLMQIKPIVEAYRGQVVLLEKSRTLGRAQGRMIQMIQALGPLERAMVLHANARAQAERLAARLQAIAPEWEPLIGQAGVTIASHAGPGAIGIACVARE